MPDEVVAHHAEFVVLTNTADETVPFLILAQREHAYTLLLDLCPAAFFSADRVDGQPAICGSCTQNSHVLPLRLRCHILWPPFVPRLRLRVRVSDSYDVPDLASRGSWITLLTLYPGA